MLVPHQRQQKVAIRPGDWVRVRKMPEIVATLDDQACCGGVQFMPEMAQHSGKLFRVKRLAHKLCVDRKPVQVCSLSDAVILQLDRCDGNGHGGCQMACELLWRHEWLQASASAISGHTRDAAKQDDNVTDDARKLIERSARCSSNKENCYRCQLTEIHRLAKPLPARNIRQYITDIGANDVELRSVAAFFFRRLRSKILGEETFSGDLSRTPEVDLQLQVGDEVRVRSWNDIRATLDSKNCNRGLWFDYNNMHVYCGKTMLVSRRVERLINERTGKLMQLKLPAIVLAETACSGIYTRFCTRGSLFFWREIWLERTQ